MIEPCFEGCGIFLKITDDSNPNFYDGYYFPYSKDIDEYYKGDIKYLVIKSLYFEKQKKRTYINSDIMKDYYEILKEYYNM